MERMEGLILHNYAGLCAYTDKSFLFYRAYSNNLQRVFPAFYDVG